MNEQWVSVCGRNRVVRRVLFIAAMVVFFAVTATYCLGDDYQAVVRIGGCSGICVDPCGIVLTAKHCEHGPTETVFFPDRTASQCPPGVCRGRSRRAGGVRL